VNLYILKTELTTDPLGRAYSGMLDEAAALDLNTVYRERSRASMTGSSVLNAIDQTELNSKTDAQQQTIWNILHLGEINPFGVEASMMTAIFGAGSATIVALTAARKEAVSRAAELGLGVVREGEVTMARAL
jgi:hypothetical protein